MAPARAEHSKPPSFDFSWGLVLLINSLSPWVERVGTAFGIALGTSKEFTKHFFIHTSLVPFKWVVVGSLLWRNSFSIDLQRLRDLPRVRIKNWQSQFIPPTPTL